MPGLQQFSDNWKLERLPATCGCLCILLRIKEINTNLCYVNDSQCFGDESKWEQATIYRSNQSSLLVWVFPTTVGARVSHYLTFTLNRCQVLGCPNCIGHALNSLSTETGSRDATCDMLNFGYVTKTLLSAKKALLQESTVIYNVCDTCLYEWVTVSEVLKCINVFILRVSWPPTSGA